MTNGGVLGTNAPLRQFHISSHFMWIMWLHGDKNHSHMTSGCEQSKFLKAFDTPSSDKSGWINGKNVWNSRWLHSSAIKTTHWQAKQCEIMFLFPFCLLFLLSRLSFTSWPPMFALHTDDIWQDVPNIFVLKTKSNGYTHIYRHRVTYLILFVVLHRGLMVLSLHRSRCTSFMKSNCSATRTSPTLTQRPQVQNVHEIEQQHLRYSL